MICHPDTMSGLIPKLMGGACFENHLLITNYWLDTKLLIKTSRRHTSESAAKHLLLFKKKKKRKRKKFIPAHKLYLFYGAQLGEHNFVLNWKTFSSNTDRVPLRKEGGPSFLFVSSSPGLARVPSGFDGLMKSLRRCVGVLCSHVSAIATSDVYVLIF